jgi:hypothetical protein
LKLVINERRLLNKLGIKIEVQIDLEDLELKIAIFKINELKSYVARFLVDNEFLTIRN